MCGFLSRVNILIHAERDTVMANMSVCLSVCHILVLYLNESLTPSTIGCGMTSF